LVAVRHSSQPINAAHSFFDFANRSVKYKRDFAGRFDGPVIIGGKFFDPLTEIHALIAEIQIGTARPDEFVEVFPWAHYRQGRRNGNRKSSSRCDLPWCGVRRERKLRANASYDREQGHKR
jgi:hypothetical protein